MEEGRYQRVHGSHACSKDAVRDTQATPIGREGTPQCFVDTHLSGLEPPVVEACKIERVPEPLNTSMHASMQRPFEFEIAPWLHWHELRFTARSTPTYL